MERLNTVAVPGNQLSNAQGILDIPPNENRDSIIVSIPAGAVAFVQVGPSDSSTLGIQLNSNMAYLELKGVDYGTALKGPIRLINNAGVAMTFSWVQFLISP